MTLMLDKTLPIVVAALAGSLAGVLLGRGIKAIIEDWEGPAAPAQ